MSASSLLIVHSPSNGYREIATEEIQTSSSDLQCQIDKVLGDADMGISEIIQVTSIAITHDANFLSPVQNCQISSLFNSSPLLQFD